MITTVVCCSNSNFSETAALQRRPMLLRRQCLTSWLTAGACGFLLATLTLHGTQPPDPGTLKGYQQDGSYARRLDFVNRVGNHKLRPDVAQRTKARLRSLFSPGPEKMAVLPRWQGMPTKGTNKILVFLIDFPDYPHVNDANLVTSKLFGDGVAAEYPQESLRNYYRRASYDQLEIQGMVLGWYRMQHPRSWYTGDGQENAANRAVMEEVISHFNPLHDFSQYDNNRDGKVDYVAIIWSGPDNGWGNFWWGYQWTLREPIPADGVQFADFSWQWESRPVGEPFEASTIIHETGHALGLPDYYDYTPGRGGPDGGVGGLDMMHGNYADHNAFSKFMLEWLTPRAVGSGQADVTLRALAQSPDALAVMPNYNGASPYTEYFMVENRQRLNNDSSNPSNGLLIWHIDATPNARGDDFLYNNSDTSRKLLRLMEADGLEEIENGDGKADAGDYFKQGDAFSATSQPSSRAYDGSDTRITIDHISQAGPSMTLACVVAANETGIQVACNPTRLEKQLAEGANGAEQTFQVSAPGGSVGYAIADDAAWLRVTPANGTASGAPVTHTVTYEIAGLVPGVYHSTITITAPGANNSPQRVPVTLTVMGNQLGRALDAPEFEWTTGGNGFWFEETTETHDGEDAAQSGALDDMNTNWIQTSVTGPGTLSFWWRCSSEADYDYLLLYFDGVLRPERLSGVTEWQPVSLNVPAGSHTIRWAYAKDAAVVGGADAAWVDQVRFTSQTQLSVLACAPAVLSQIAAAGQTAPSLFLEVWNEGGGAMSYTLSENADWLSVSPPAEISSGAHNQHVVSFASSNLKPGTYEAEIAITAAGASGSPKTVHTTLTVLADANSLAEATDFPGQWTTGGGASWTAQTATNHDQRDAAASGKPSDDGESWLETNVEGPGLLSFWWKVSSEEDYDWLELYVDGEYAGFAISGEEDWRHQSLMISPGRHTITWSYFKDEYLADGADMGWVDQVSFKPGDGGFKRLLQADFAEGLPNGWSVADYISSGVQWVFNDPGTRGNDTGGSGSFAIVDADHYDFDEVDTALISPLFNCTGITNVTLEFQTDFQTFDAVAEVEVFVNGAWASVGSATSSIDGPTKIVLPLPMADNKSEVAVSFRYYYGPNLFSDFWWKVDSVNITGQGSAAPACDFVPEWRNVWEVFQRNYAGFQHKGVNWAGVYDAHTNAFARVQNADQFADRLNDALQMLQDWQVSVQNPDGNTLGYNGKVTPNYPPTWFTSYTGGIPYEDVKGADTIYHAWVAPTVAHIIVNRLDTTAFQPISDADLETIFERYRQADGIILDLRKVDGGAEENAVRIASRFTDAPATYGYTRTRITGSDSGALTPFAARILVPTSGRRFSGRTACLIGQRTSAAAEWFALMMRACPQVTLIGDRTRGAAGIPTDFSIAGLGVKCAIPTKMGYDAAQLSFEDAGILPDVPIPAEASYDEAAQRDFVLERAMSALKIPSLAIEWLEGNKIVIRWNGDPNSRYNLLTSSNPTNPGAWQLAPGWPLNRQGIAGSMSYTNTQPNMKAEFYRLQIGQ